MMWKIFIHYYAKKKVHHTININVSYNIDLGPNIDFFSMEDIATLVEKFKLEAE
jgi:hypothetical protein